MDVKSVSAGAAALIFCVSLSGCASKVKGNTYDAFPISIAFNSGGEAVFSSGSVATDCTYDESGSKVTLNCGPQSMVLTIDSDGNLNGPAENIGKLTKRK
jgi:hypothetical protein